MAAAPEQIAGQLGIAGPGGGYSIAMVGLLIATFGVGYALVAHDPVRYGGIVWIGLLSKVAAATLAVLQFAAGVFVGFLWRGPRAA